MDELSQAHIAWLRRQRTKADNTIASRLRVLRSVGNAGTATREEIEAWWEGRAHLSTGTRNVDLAHLRGFYKWCGMFDHRLDDPTRRIEPPRTRNRVPKRAKAWELAQLLETVEGDLRRAVLLGAYAGTRVSEAAALSWDDIDVDESTILIRESKGGKTRLVDVSPALIDMLGPPVKGNVLTGGGKPYTPGVLQRKLNRAIKATGLDITTHSLRHRYGVAAYQATGDLLALAEMMGHSSIQTTTIYAQASTDAKKKIAAAVMR
jgi:integrase